MSEVREMLQDPIKKGLEERDGLDPGSEERERHDRVLVEYFKIYEQDFKNELEKDIESEKIKADQARDELHGKISEIEAEQRDRLGQEEIKQKKWGNIIKGVGLALGGILALMARQDEREGLMTDDRINSSMRVFEWFGKNK